MPQLIRPRALPFLLLLVGFALAGFALGQTPQQYDRTLVRFKSRDCPYKDSFAGTSANIGGVKAVSEGNGGDVLVDLSPGDYMVSNLTEPGQPNAKLVAVRVLLGNTLIKEYPANESGMANIALEENIFGHNDARQVIDVIIANDCDTGTGPTVESTPEEKKVDVILKSLECDRKSYKGYKVYFDDQTIEPDGEDVAHAVPIKNGKYRLRVSAPDFPNAKITSMSVYRPNREVYFRKESNSPGGVDDFILESDLWEGTTSTKLPAIFLYIAGDCTTAYEPPMQRIGGSPQIRVAAVEGQVTVFKDDNSAAESQLVKGLMIEDEQVVYTRPGARVELVASDKRLFILGGKTVVKFVIKKSSDGAWGVSADIRAAEQFTVRHVGYVKGEGDGYVWKVLTPTAAVTEKGTIYNVTFDESSKVTTVGVEQGQVLVTPSNSSLKPFTLDEHKKADVFENSISAVTPYLGVGDKTGGGFLGGTLFWVGVGAVGLFVFLALPIGGYVIYRVLWHTPPKPAYTPTGHEARSSTPYRAPSRDASRTPSRDASAGVRCPNPNCRRVTRPGKKFCNACGTPLH